MNRDQPTEPLVKKTPFWSPMLLILSWKEASFGRQNDPRKTRLASCRASAIQRCEQLKTEVEQSQETDILGQASWLGTGSPRGVSLLRTPLPFCLSGVACNSEESRSFLLLVPSG